MVGRCGSVVDGDRDGDGSAVLVEGGRRFDGPVAAAQVDEVEVAVGNDAGVAGSRRDGERTVRRFDIGHAEGDRSCGVVFKNRLIPDRRDCGSIVVGGDGDVEGVVGRCGSVVDGDRDGDGSAVLVEGGRRFDGPVAAAQVDEVEVAVGNDAGVCWKLP